MGLVEDEEAFRGALSDVLKERVSVLGPPQDLMRDDEPRVRAPGVHAEAALLTSTPDERPVHDLEVKSELLLHLVAPLEAHGRRANDEHELDVIVTALNASGNGLTLGIHSRIDTRVDDICARARIGNIYVNRDQIGAVVGVQPFGGVGLSGTGPKAGGPHYVPRFTRPMHNATTSGRAPSAALRAMRDALPAALCTVADAALARAGDVSFAPLALPGVTGERNTYTLHPRGTALCLGPTAEDLVAQVLLALGIGNRVLLAHATGGLTLSLLAQAAQGAGLDNLAMLEGELDAVLQEATFDLVLFDGATAMARRLRGALAMRAGPRIALLQAADDAVQLCVERVVSEDTTAAGGNTTLLALSR